MEFVSENSINNTPGNTQILVIGDALIDHQYWIKRIPNPGLDKSQLHKRKIEIIGDQYGD